MLERNWTNAVCKADAATGKNWTTESYDRICSDHFIDGKPGGKPTAVNPFPTINLRHRGMEFLSDSKINKKKQLELCQYP